LSEATGLPVQFQGFLDFCLLFIDGKVEARPAQGRGTKDQALVAHHYKITTYGLH